MSVTIADPSRRILARALEGLIPSTGVVVGLLGGLLGSGTLVRVGGTLFLVLLIGVLAANAYLVTRHGQTVGKGWLGLRITRPDGSPPRFLRGFLVRELLVGVLGAIPVLGVLFSLADGLLLIFGERRRSLHDVMADTIVIDERA